MESAKFKTYVLNKRYFREKQGHKSFFNTHLRNWKKNRLILKKKERVRGTKCYKIEEKRNNKQN